MDDHLIQEPRIRRGGRPRVPPPRAPETPAVPATLPRPRRAPDEIAPRH